MKAKLQLIESKTKTSEPTIGFKQIDDNTLRLQFGDCRIEIKANGHISFANANSSIEISDANISLKNQRGEMLLNADGEIIQQGQQIKQQSRHHIKLDAKQNIYLNSE